MRPFVNSPNTRILLFCITLAVFAILVAQSLVAAPPLVTSTLDNVVADGACTLREAILSANGTPANPDCAVGTNITFDPTILNITIDSGAPLPPLTVNGITIDGALNLAEIVTITGAAGAGDGLTIQSANNVIRSLAIVDFPGNGIVIEGAAATGNTLRGLFVGTNIALEPDLGNGGNGIIVRGGAQGNNIGIFPITNLADRNTVGGNTLNGVQFADVDTSNNILTGTIIGVRSDFGGVLPNGESGVSIATGASNNQIGVLDSDGDSRNVIAGNTGSGLNISNDGTDGNTVQNNLIGIDPANNSRPNVNGIVISLLAARNIIANNQIESNTANGVLITTLAETNVVGDTNIIARNGASGVTIAGAINNTVNANLIEENTFNGVTIIGDGTNNNVVSLNTIQNNAQDGVVINNNVTGNTITQNSINTNGQLGIDLGDNGVTPNDAGDADVGPNELQNFPQSLLAVNNGTNTVLAGVMDGGANGPFTIEVFSNDAGENEGEVFQGTGTFPNGTFTLNLPVGIPAPLTTTTTNSLGSTSEFSPPVQIIALNAQFVANPETGVAPLTVNFINGTVVNPANTPLTYTWDFGDNTPTSNQQNPTHIYTQPGTYTATLTVCVSDGVVSICDETTRTITVIAASPTPTQTSNSPTIPATATNTSLPPSTPVPPTATSTVPTSTSVPPTNTPVFTRTPNPTNTPLPSPTPSFTFTFTPTFTETLTLTPTFTPSLTSSRTPTLTFTPTFTQTFTFTPSPTLTITPSQTRTLTPQPTNTFTPSPTPPMQVTVIKEPVDDDTFTIIVDNEGADLTNVVVQEELRPGVIYLSSQPGSPLCRQNAGVITCTVGTLPNGQAFEVDIDVDTEGVDIVSGQTSVRSDTFGTTIDEAYILKSSQPPFAAPGEQVTYSIRVINPTSRTITGVTVRDRMPDAVQIESVTSSVGRATQTGQDIALDVASLEPGGRITITIVGRLREGDASPQIANRACLTTTGVPRPRCAVAGFIRANALPATGEGQILPYMVGGLAALMVIGTSIFILQQRRR